MTLIHGPAGGWALHVGGLASGVPEVVEVSATATRLLDDSVINYNELPLFFSLVDYNTKKQSGFFTRLQLYLLPPDSSDSWEFICALGGEQVEICATMNIPDTEQSVVECV